MQSVSGSLHPQAQIFGVAIMQFVYRGIAYQSPEKSAQSEETGILARFLGRSYPVRRSTEQHRHTSAKLTYRGRPVNPLD
jgi:hypothetical protein